MRLPEFGTFDALVDTDSELSLRLRGSFSNTTTVTRDGQPLGVQTDGTTATVTLPPGTSSLGVSQPAQIRATPCSRGRVRVRVRAPRGDRLRSVRVYVCGKRVKAVRGRALRRPIFVELPRAGARVTVRATTRKVAASFAAAPTKGARSRNDPLRLGRSGSAILARWRAGVSARS